MPGKYEGSTFIRGTRRAQWEENTHRNRNVGCVRRCRNDARYATEQSGVMPPIAGWETIGRAGGQRGDPKGFSPAKSRLPGAIASSRVLNGPVSRSVSPRWRSTRQLQRPPACSAVGIRWWRPPISRRTAVGRCGRHRHSMKATRRQYREGESQVDVFGYRLVMVGMGDPCHSRRQMQPCLRFWTRSG